MGEDLGDFTIPGLEGWAYTWAGRPTSVPKQLQTFPAWRHGHPTPHLMVDRHIRDHPHLLFCFLLQQPRPKAFMRKGQGREEGEGRAGG